jgi:hypothetical protein
MTMKITQPMVSVLKKMGDGAEYDEFDVSGPLSTRLPCMHL